MTRRMRTRLHEQDKGVFKSLINKKQEQEQKRKLRKNFHFY